MPTTELSSNELLEVVQRMPPAEFDAFIERALSLRPQPKASTLSAKETRLIERINRGLSVALVEALRSVDRAAEEGDFDRRPTPGIARTHQRSGTSRRGSGQALLKLARLRRVSVRTLMKQMGIRAAPIDG